MKILNKPYNLLIPILLIGIILLTGCNKSDVTSALAPAPAAPTKGFWSSWTGSSLSMDLQGGDFYTDETIVIINIQASTQWISKLNTAGRDTTGLFAGYSVNCEYSLYVAGSHASGNITMNHPDIDYPTNNVCLEYDNNCTLGVCNYDSAHVYSIIGPELKIDYFGGSDSGFYGVSRFE